MIMRHYKGVGGPKENRNQAGKWNWAGIWVIGSKGLSLLFQLPVPIAVLVLMYFEKLIPCCPNGSPRLLDKDELAMQTNATECAEAQEQESGGTDKEQNMFT